VFFEEAIKLNGLKRDKLLKMQKAGL